ncbi:fumarylacetoacetate hydrolase family protein [Dyella jejuensis]|uniref:Fumarylacetoacetate hydrolase family protein n=1 Tax=Dyella jejuensis TaxID=1432009 RepID=A0ABW8JN94_9GAMM
MVETRRIVLQGTTVEVLRDGDVLRAPDGRTVRADEAIHLPPCVPTKIICAHLNFMNRVVELKTISPDTPSYFQKPTSALNSHKGQVVRPQGCKYLNYEGEVGIVVGRTCRNVRMADAEHYIEGYTIANDFGLHDFRETDRGSMVRVKGADTLGPLGPGLVRGWHPEGKVLRTRVNGKVMQEASLDDLIWSMAYLLADLSRTHTFFPGDVILTGTPANSRPVQPGDVVTVAVDGLGELENHIVEGASGISNECGSPPVDSVVVRGVALGEGLKE